MNSAAGASDEPSAGRRVLQIWYGDYPWDVRIQKVVLGLTRRGWTVDLIARNRNALSDQDQVDGARVYRLPRLRLVGARLNAVLSFPAFVNPKWIWHIWRIARKTRPSVMLVRDLPLAPAAMWLGRAMGIPVVLDLAENYAGLLRTRWETGVARPLDTLVRNPRLAAHVERWVIRRADAVVCVIEESANRIKTLGVPEERIVIVRNTPIDSRGVTHVEARPPGNGPLVVVYLGLVERHRGVQDLVRAVAECVRRGWHVKLVVVGDGIGFGDIERLATQLGVLGHAVELLGRLDNKRALEIVAQAHVGAIPHVPCDAWNTTIPNKLFDYMACGLPVLTSNVAPVQRIVSEERCGVQYRSGDVMDLVGAIDQLRSPESRRRMSAAGIEAVRAKYNWCLDAERLHQALTNVVVVRREKGARSN